MSKELVERARGFIANIKWGDFVPANEVLELLHELADALEPTREKVREELLAAWSRGCTKHAEYDEDAAMRRLFPEPEAHDPFKPDPSLTLSNEGPTQDDLRRMQCPYPPEQGYEPEGENDD